MALYDSAGGGERRDGGDITAALPADLTPRQREVLGLYALGLTAQEVAADRLDVSKRVVQWHTNLIIKRSGKRHVHGALAVYGTWSIRPEYGTARTAASFRFDRDHKRHLAWAARVRHAAAKKRLRAAE